MARNLDPKCKQCRRLSEKLFLKGERCFTPKCAMIKRNYPPGMHGPKGSKRVSQFGQQLMEKQKTIKSYRLLETAFSNYFAKAKQMKGDTGENLIRLLELRLDNVIYKLGLASSRDAARQIISHGEVLVNNKKVDIPSFQVKANDQISIKDSFLQRKNFQETLKKINTNNLPAWLAFTDEKNAQAKILALPTSVDVKQGINASMIVEYYSR